MAVALYATLGASCRNAGPDQQHSSHPVTLTIGAPELTSARRESFLAELRQLFTNEGLTIQGNDGRVSGGLAEDWLVADDGLTWQLRLRRGVKFSDGTPLDPAAAKASIDRALSEPGVRMLRPGLADIISVAAIDPATVELRLKARSAFLLDDLTLAITHKAADGTESGTGPFRVVKAVRDEITLDANRDYYLGPLSIDRIVLRSFATLRMTWASLMRGDLDMVSDVPHDVLEFVGANRVQIYKFARPYQYLVAFNSSRKPFTRAPVRRALNAAVDRDALIRTAFKGAGQPANGPLWPYHWAYDRSIPRYTYDPSMAAAALDASGLRLGSAPSGGGRPPARLRFTCLVPKDYAILERLALIVQKQLYDVGVDMGLESVAFDAYDRRLRAGDFDAAVVDMISGPSFARPYHFWHSPEGFQGLNVFGYRNSEADRWLDALRHAADDGAFRAAASQLQRTLLQDPPALFLVWSERARVLSRRFRVGGEADADILRKLRLWRSVDTSPETSP